MMLQAVVFPSILMIQTLISYINLCFSILEQNNEIIQSNNFPRPDEMLEKLPLSWLFHRHFSTNQETSIASKRPPYSARTQQKHLVLAE